VAVGSVLGLPSETSGARGHGPGHAIQVVPSLRLGLARRPGPDAVPFPLAEDTLRLHPGIGAAIVAGVRALGMSVGDGVLVPAYHSAGHVDALLGAGLHCTAYGVTDGLEPDAADLDRRAPSARALYLVHYNGFPQDADRWRRWCDDRGLLLIEDVAHAWLARWHDAALGVLGDLSVFSLSATVGRPAGAASVAGRSDAAGGARGRGDIAGAARALLVSRLALMTIAERRRSHYRILLDELGDRVPTPFRSLPDGAVPLLLPVTAHAVDTQLARLSAQGIVAARPYASLHPTLAPGTWPELDERRRTTIGLPVHQELRARDLARIVDAMRTSARPRRGPLLEPVDTLDAARAEWTLLAARSRNVFSTWEWADVWWRHFGAGKSLEAFILRDASGAPIAVLPLYVWATRPLGVVRFIGHGPAELLGPICAPGDIRTAGRALPAALDRLGAPSDVLLAEQMPGLEWWPSVTGGRVIAESGFPIVRMPTGGWTPFFAAKSRNFRQTLRKKERRLAAEHAVTFRLASDPAMLQNDLDVLFRLHRARWADAATGFGGRDREAFHREFAACAMANGWLRLWFLEVDGEPVAALYGFRFAGTQAGYQTGRSPEWGRHSVGYLLMMHALRDAFDAGVSEYRLLRGEYEYKARVANADDGLRTVGIARTARGHVALRAIDAARRTPAIRDVLGRGFG
jgi:CelD/BcsL family acetyltransferase involved in cellulose biosynthesis